MQYPLSSMDTFVAKWGTALPHSGCLTEQSFDSGDPVSLLGFSTPPHHHAEHMAVQITRAERVELQAIHEDSK